jgi:hypothetical protein
MKSPQRSRSLPACVSLAAAAFLLSGVAPACGSSKERPDDGGTDAAGVVEAIGCTDPDPGVLDYIDNMEDGDYLGLARDGRSGAWYTYADETSGTINPARSTANFPMEPIPQPRCGSSTRAMRVTGSGFTDWGSGFGVSMRSVMINGVWGSGPYDGTTARGVTFWARRGESSVESIRMNIVDQQSSGEGGICDITVPSGDLACYDHFGDSVLLTTAWKRYTYQFGALQQRNFGKQRPNLEVSTIMNVEFNIPAGATVFDIWIDDLAFIR